MKQLEKEINVTSQRNNDEEVPDVWCHSIKADREITE